MTFQEAVELAEQVHLHAPCDCEVCGANAELAPTMVYREDPTDPEGWLLKETIWICRACWSTAEAIDKIARGLRG